MKSFGFFISAMTGTKVEEPTEGMKIDALAETPVMNRMGDDIVT